MFALISWSDIAFSKFILSLLLSFQFAFLIIRQLSIIIVLIYLILKL